MSRTTTKDLFKLTVEEIVKRSSYPGVDTTTQMSRNQTFGVSGEGANVNQIINSIFDVLHVAIEPRIVSGLSVKETNPTSSSVIIEPGRGVVGGRVFQIYTSVTLSIPLTTQNKDLYYVCLSQGGVRIDYSVSEDSLLLAKIIIPQPGTTNIIRNKRSDDNPFDGYIVNMKEVVLYQDPNGFLEEDSIDFLRDNISPILADNLIGNIRLNEDLKIINTAGTLELNSDSLKLYDVNDNNLMKLNRYGTFFYDINGIELAKFSVDEARVGNIKITTTSVESGNFVSGALGSGFRIQDTGDAEFNNIRARGKITTSVFEKLAISVVGGNLLVMDGDKLESDL